MFLYLSVDRHLDCSHVLYAVEKVITNTSVNVFLWTQVVLLFGRYLGEEFLGLTVDLRREDIVKPPFKITAAVCILPATAESSSCSTSSLTLVLSSF